MSWLLLACSASGLTAITRPGPGPSPGPSSGPRASVDAVEGPTPPVTVEDAGQMAPQTFPHLAVFLIDTSGRSIPDNGDKIPGSLEVIRDHDGTLTDLAAAPRAWFGPIGIEVHGTSSSSEPKKGYQFETRDALGADLDVSLLDLGKDSDWVLVSSYGDKTYLRNPLAYGLGRELAASAGRFEPGTAFVEVFVNGDYQGVYVLVERVKRDPQRLDLPAPAANAVEGDITGGYVFKIDEDRDWYFTTDRGSMVGLADPQADQITPAQLAYLKGWFGDFETMLARSDAPSEYGAWLDLDAFVDHFIVNELAHNIDAYRLSAYLYKEADADGGLLRAGPLWDYDRAWGNVNYCDCFNIEGLIQDDLTTCGYGSLYPYWWQRLRDDPTFQNAVRCRWDELRAGPLADDALVARVADLRAEVAEAEPRDHALWGTIGSDVGYNYFVGATYQEEIDYLDQWTRERAAWLDANLPGQCP